MTQAQAGKLRIALGFAAIYLIWGSTYLAIRFVVEELPPFLMAGVRFLVGGTLFYGWALIRRAEKPTLAQWRSAAIIGTLLLLGGNGLVSWAEKTVPSGLTALLIAMVALWVVLFDWWRPGGVRPRLVVVVGLVLGFAGVGALVDPTNVSGVEEINFIGALAIGLATILWAWGSVYSRRAALPKSKSQMVGMQMLTGGLALIVFGALVGEFSELQTATLTARSLWALVYLITMGSVGFSAYIWLLQVCAPAKVATYSYVNPVIALALGAALAGEALSSWTIGCATVILLSVILIVTSKSKTSAGDGIDHA